MKNKHALAVSFMLELSTWLSFTESEVEGLQNVSDDNVELLQLQSDWKDGKYDEDPQELKADLLRLIPN